MLDNCWPRPATYIHTHVYIWITTNLHTNYLKFEGNAILLRVIKVTNHPVTSQWNGPSWSCVLCIHTSSHHAWSWYSCSRPVVTCGRREDLLLVQTSAYAMCGSVLLSYLASLSYEPTTFIEDITDKKCHSIHGQSLYSTECRECSANILETEHSQAHK